MQFLFEKESRLAILMATTALLLLSNNSYAQINDWICSDAGVVNGQYQAQVGHTSLEACTALMNTYNVLAHGNAIKRLNGLNFPPTLTWAEYAVQWMRPGIDTTWSGASAATATATPTLDRLHIKPHACMRHFGKPIYLLHPM